jgi:hypothetical protein
VKQTEKEQEKKQNTGICIYLAAPMHTTRFQARRSLAIR